MFWQDLNRLSVFGHSMGGHGALTLYLLSTIYRSASAFSPICNPSNEKCQWGQKAFKGYLSGGPEEGKKNDATELIRSAKGKQLNILIDYVGLSEISFLCMLTQTLILGGCRPIL